MTEQSVPGPSGPRRSRESGQHDFAVPDLGEGLEEATIVAWLVTVGDRVSLNQPLCTLETAKAEVEVPSPFAGTVTALGG
jgi:2-oxoisovalerate dehydrogenase E2 component (dihydrolipoyl transacylase)